MALKITLAADAARKKKGASKGGSWSLGDIPIIDLKIGWCCCPYLTCYEHEVDVSGIGCRGPAVEVRNFAITALRRTPDYSRLPAQTGHGKYHSITLESLPSLGSSRPSLKGAYVNILGRKVMA